MAYRNPQKQKEANKLWWANHPEKLKAKKRRAREKNIDRAREVERQHYRQNAEAKKAYQRAYHAAHKNDLDYIQECRERSRCSQRKHSLRRECAVRNYRARKRGVIGTHCAKDITELYERQKQQCSTCHAAISLVPSHKDKCHVDHIMPLILGGTNYPDNLQLLCKSCNRRKNRLHPEERARRCSRVAVEGQVNGTP